MSATAEERLRVLYAEFTARSGREHEVATLLAELAVRVRAEPGCIVFSPHRLTDRPSAFFVYEVYRDEDAFQAHISADYGIEFNRRLGSLIVENGSQLTWLRTLLD